MTAGLIFLPLIGFYLYLFDFTGFDVVIIFVIAANIIQFLIIQRLNSEIRANFSSANEQKIMIMPSYGNKFNEPGQYLEHNNHLVFLIRMFQYASMALPWIFYVMLWFLSRTL